MAQFSQQEQDQMRREAMRRAQEMRRRSTSAHASPPSDEVLYSDSPDDSPPVSPAPFVSQKPPDMPPRPPGSIPLLNGLLRGNSTAKLSEMDGDTMLILALLAMLYKDGGFEGCDKKLLMALIYLLT